MVSIFKKRNVAICYWHNAVVKESLENAFNDIKNEETLWSFYQDTLGP